MDRVMWRLEIPAGWGQRLDPAWLPNSGEDAWKQVFAGEDYAARVFSAGGGGLPWKVLAQAAAQLAGVLQQYRMQWWCAEAVARGCTVAAGAHVAAMAVPHGLRAPRRSGPGGAWRVCVLDDGLPAAVAEFSSADHAEGAACAHRTMTADRAWWAEPAAAGPPPDRAGAPGWLPVADTDLRLTAFAAEDAVADLTSAAAGVHLGPDVLVPPAGSSPHISAAQLPADQAVDRPEYTRYEDRSPAWPAETWIHRYTQRTSGGGH